MVTPGWGAVLKGHQFDLRNWAESLKAPFEPHVEIHGGDYVLRMSSLHSLPTPQDVRRVADEEIKRLNGLMSLSSGAKPVSVVAVVDILPDGSRAKTYFAFMEAAATMRILGLHPPTITVTRAGQIVPDPPPQKSTAQSWFAAANQDAGLSTALVYFGQSSDWSNIYKTLECLQMRCGGEDGLLAKTWASPWPNHKAEASGECHGATC
jgi:hypothetical protein